MQGKKMSLTFALRNHGALVRRETLTQDVIKIGRDAKSHLCLDDELASRMHAVIEVSSTNEITLIDLGNEPGTQVNGVRVMKAKLAVGDTIAVGGTSIVLEGAEAVALASAPRLANPFASSAPLPATFDPFAYNNPFISSAVEPDGVPADAPEGSYTYALVKGGPDLSAEECETHASSVEVMITWGTTVLHVAHLTPPRSFYVGEEERKNISCDYFVPAETLGATRAPIVLEDKGSVRLVLLPAATGTVTLAGAPVASIGDLMARGATQPCAEIAGAQELPLPPGSKARIEVGGLVFEVSTVNAGRKVGNGVALDGRTLPYTGLSLLGHAAILGAMAFFMPPLGVTDGDGVTSDQQYMLQQALNDASAIKEQPDKEDPSTNSSTPDREGGSGQRAVGEEGSMGSTTSHDTNKRYAIQGPADNRDVRIASAAAALKDAANYGMIGLLASMASGDPNAVTAPWGGNDSLGKDPMSALGNMWGPDIGEAAGNGGFGLSGTGNGGGGRGLGIGLGTIGTIDHGSGNGDGEGNGWGHGGVGGRGHKSKGPTMRVGTESVSGRIPPEVIQRIVRQNFGRFRLCYENGLRNSPNLAGRVAVRFIIGRDGAVSSVGNGGSDLPDSGVVSCVVRAFYGLSFPQPDGGIVSVTYPIAFSPG